MTPDENVVVIERPNRATRRAYRRQTQSYQQARWITRPLRRAFGGWAGAFRPTHPSVKP